MTQTRRQAAIRRFSDAMIMLRGLDRADKDGVPEASCVTPAQGMLVREIALAGGATTGALASRLGISSSAVTQLVNVLEAEGIVDRAGDPTDGRKARIGLTAYGEKLYAQFDRARISQASRRLEPLADAEAEELVRLLTKITGNCP